MADFHRRDSFLRNADTFEGFLDLNELPRIQVISIFLAVSDLAQSMIYHHFGFLQRNRQ